MKNKLILTLCLCASVVISFAQNEITLEDIWTKGTFSAKGVSGFQSMKDGRYYCAQDDNENIIRYSFASGKAIDTLVKSAELKLKGFTYSWSSDESKLLLQTNFKQIYRHSFAANVYVFDIKTRKVVQPITEQVMLAEFSPDATKIAYVKDHNLFCFDLNTGKEIQITQDGKTNAIINGATDWVYEEEFALSKGFYWSPDGTMLAYYRFDESEVKEFGMSMYGKLYPEEYKFKYPKAGEANSVIEIYIYHIPTNKKQKIDIGSETDIYIPRVNWARSNTLMIQRMNRLQNKLYILLANASNGKSDIIYTEENKAYIEVPEIHLPADGKTFILNSEKSGWNHFYQYDFSGKLIRQLTSGNWDVDQFYGIDEKKKLFYISTSEINSTERYVYACSMDGKTRKQLTKRKGWNSATFNADYSYFLLNQSAIHQPPYYALCDASGKEVRVLEDNQLLKERLTKYDLTTAEITNYKNAYGESLNAFMMKPKIFDATKKYPVLMYVYGGPGHQLAVNRWMGGNYFWYQLLAAKGYMIVCVDGRVTGFKGEAFKKSTYLQLGKYEIEDQIFVAKELGKLPYIDAGRIGIWGWSFGGYMASLGISKGADVFKTA
ncbi:MAG: S9 family peptidase, partial [Bacteroidota bacterium]